MRRQLDVTSRGSGTCKVGKRNETKRKGNRKNQTYRGSEEDAKGEARRAKWYTYIYVCVHGHVFSRLNSHEPFLAYGSLLRSSHRFSTSLDFYFASVHPAAKNPGLSNAGTYKVGTGALVCCDRLC